MLLCTYSHHESTRHLLDKRGMGMNSLTAPIPGPPVSGPGQSGGSRHVTMPEVILSFLLFHPIKVGLETTRHIYVSKAVQL